MIKRFTGQEIFVILMAAAVLVFIYIVLIIGVADDKIGLVEFESTDYFAVETPSAYEVGGEHITIVASRLHHSYVDIQEGRFE